MTNLSPQLTELEAFFSIAVEIARRETLGRFRTPTAIINKRQHGFDPVTEADRATEIALRAEIVKRWPDHGIIGEEEGITNPHSPCQWIIDPIDGTRAFISGIPVWGTLIGFYVEGKPLAGLMVQPFTGEVFYTLGQESLYLNRTLKDSDPATIPTRLVTSSVERMEDAILMTTDTATYGKTELPCFERLRSAARLTRYSCDCYAFAMLAAGHVDMVVEAGLQIYDIAALIPIIRNAGGIITNWQDGDASTGGNVLASANRKLHERALDLLNG